MTSSVKGAGGKGLLQTMTIEQIFDTLAQRLKLEEVGGLAVVINWTFSDSHQQWQLSLSNGALAYREGWHTDHADVALELSKKCLIDIMTQSTSVADELQAGRLSFEGDLARLALIFTHLDTFDPEDKPGRRE